MYHSDIYTFHKHEDSKLVVNEYYYIVRVYSHYVQNSIANTTRFCADVNARADCLLCQRVCSLLPLCHSMMPNVCMYTASIHAIAVCARLVYYSMRAFC